MRIALGLPSRVVDASGEMMLDWATRADRGPFSSVVVTDRVVSQALEPLAVLAMAAGATRRIRLMTSVVIGPTRETTLLARQAATIDVISNGRLTLGIGIGVRENDYLATGLDFHRRGRRVEEQLPILRRLWAGEPLSNEMGPIGPQSPRPGGPELLIGGYVPAIVQRIAKWGDGYMAPGGGEPQAMLKMWQQILQAWQDNGRQASRAGSAPATSPWDRMRSITPPAISITTMATIRNSRRNDCARYRRREKRWRNRSSAKPTWAWTNSYCVRARRI